MKFKLTPKRLKFGLNLYGPFRGAAIRIKYVSDDWREMRVAMKMRWYNRNIAGVHFGGSLYAMVDPQYMVMLQQILGKDYIVWDKAAHIDFVKPGKGTVHASFALSEEDIEAIKAHTAAGEKYLPIFHVDILDSNNDVVAKVKKTLYVKKKRKRQQQDKAH